VCERGSLLQLNKLSDVALAAVDTSTSLMRSRLGAAGLSPCASSLCRTISATWTNTVDVAVLTPTLWDDVRRLALAQARELWVEPAPWETWPAAGDESPRLAPGRAEQTFALWFT
jgi:hypothetical protein